MAKIIIPDSSDFPKSADVVVIGGGIVGVATAFYTSRAGLDTVLLEMRDGLGTLSTAASAETFRALFDEPEVVAMMKTSIEVFENFAAVVGLPHCDIGMHQQGYLFVSDEPDAPQSLRTRAEHKQSIGLEDVEFLTGDEARRYFPFISSRATAAIYRARDGWLSAHEATYGFARGSEALFLLHTKATGLELDGGGVCGVQTERGTVETRAVVVAAGPFSGQVAGWAGVELPLDVICLQKVVVGPHPLIPQSGPVAVDWVTGSYWRPEVGGALLGWADPYTPNVEPSENVLADWRFPAIVLKMVSKSSPFWKEIAADLKQNHLFTSAGQVAYTLDAKPILGPVPGVGGLFLNAGHSFGVMASPVAGRYVAEMITGQMSVEDNPFNYERFAEWIA
ncbi:MAG: FAD-binding oxidoreductase [Chloroflexota bacterium]|nr:FAD-binding oxidoreductase [Chloroflexota bacterium]